MQIELIKTKWNQGTIISIDGKHRYKIVQYDYTYVYLKYAVYNPHYCVYVSNPWGQFGYYMNHAVTEYKTRADAVLAMVKHYRESLVKFKLK